MLTTSVFDKTLKPFKDGKTIIISEGGQSSSKTYSILQIIIFLAKVTNILNNERVILKPKISKKNLTI